MLTVSEDARCNGSKGEADWTCHICKENGIGPWTALQPPGLHTTTLIMCYNYKAKF